jgi:hypothetical protein
MPFICRSVLKPAWTHPGPVAAQVRRWGSEQGWISFGTVATPTGLSWTWTHNGVHVRLVADEARRTLFLETSGDKPCSGVHRHVTRFVDAEGLTSMTALAHDEAREHPERLWQLALMAPVLYDVDVACVLLRFLHVGSPAVRALAIEACQQVAWPELAPSLLAQMARRDGLSRAATMAWRACGGTLDVDDLPQVTLELVA